MTQQPIPWADGAGAAPEESGPEHRTAARPISPRPRQAALAGESRVERAFRLWIVTDDGRRVEAEVVRRARLLAARGKRHYGIAALIESIRFDFSVQLLGDASGYRINNSHRSLLARRVMQTYADLAGFFEVRDLRGRVA